MKKILILSFALVCLFSCSSSDTDPIDSDTSGEVITPGGGDSSGGDNSGGNSGGDNSGGDSGSGSDNSGGDSSGGDNSGGDSETSDRIIGTWTLFLGTDQVEVNDCLKKTTFIFNEDNSYSQIEFKIENNVCEEVLNVAGEWTSKGNNVYELRRHGYTSGPDVDFEFTDDNQTMIVVRQTYKKQ